MEDKERDSKGLTPAQHKCIELILAGEHYKDIAKELDVAPETIRRWRTRKNFTSELDKQRTKAAKSAQNVMATNASYAAQRIAEMMDDPDATATQLKAAIKVYDSAVDIARIEELEAELAELREGAETKLV